MNVLVKTQTGGASNAPFMTARHSDGSATRESMAEGTAKARGAYIFSSGRKTYRVQRVQRMAICGTVYFF